MPSLRRTLSSPSGRSSPYAHPSCSSSSTTLSTRAGSRGPRRSSGSDTAERRVLADLDCWRVEASQREVRGLSPFEPLRAATPSSDSEEELDQEERPPSPAPATVPFPTTVPHTLVPPAYNAPGAGTESVDDTVSHILNFAFGEPDAEPLEASSPLTQFATLTISSQGRSSFRRSASISSMFSDASFVSDASFSTPSFAPSFSPSGGLALSFADIASCPSTDDSDDEVPLPIRSRPSSARAAPTRRTVSYSAFEDSLSYSGWSDDESWTAPSTSIMSGLSEDDWY